MNTSDPHLYDPKAWDVWPDRPRPFPDNVSLFLYDTAAGEWHEMIVVPYDLMTYLIHAHYKNQPFVLMSDGVLMAWSKDAPIGLLRQQLAARQN